MRRGTTSACAENTKLLYSGLGGLRNYLRVRGEYSAGLKGFSSCMELPPRARRILRLRPVARHLGGTTSACAENTGWGFTMATSHGNYLRVRGEYPIVAKEPCICLELPPRARRIQGSSLRENPQRGTTSACAENTAHMWASHRPRRNYLRVRGEYHHQQPPWPPNAELPPRARRIQIHFGNNATKIGTTSACAENT